MSRGTAVPLSHPPQIYFPSVRRQTVDKPCRNFPPETEQVFTPGNTHWHTMLHPAHAYRPTLPAQLVPSITFNAASCGPPPLDWSTVLRGCKFDSNVAPLLGGALSAQGTVVVDSTHFVRNSATLGGAIGAAKANVKCAVAILHTQPGCGSGIKGRNLSAFGSVAMIGLQFVLSVCACSCVAV